MKVAGHLDASGRSFWQKWPAIRGKKSLVQKYSKFESQMDGTVYLQRTGQFSVWRSPIFEFLGRLKSNASQKDIKLPVAPTYTAHTLIIESRY